MPLQKTSALLLTSPGCVHCHSLKNTMKKLLDEGLILKLDIIDVVSHPETAAKYNVKSVPWLKLGEFEFHGSQSEAELRQWIARLNKSSGVADYFRHCLATGELDHVISMIRAKPHLIKYVLDLVSDEEKDMKLQLGISAVFEEFEGNNILLSIVDRLGDLVRHQDPKIRADVAHYLSLYRNDQTLSLLYVLAGDSDRQVSEIAGDILRQWN